MQSSPVYGLPVHKEASGSDPLERERPPHSADLRKHRCSQELHLYFVTKCLADGCELSPRQRTEICDALQLVRHLRVAYLHAFVVMPDHWHALFNLGLRSQGALDLGSVVRRIDRWASFASRTRSEKMPWQEEFYDHGVRPGVRLAKLVRYIENNPVRSNLVSRPGDWAWSSASEPWCHMLDRHLLGHERWEDP